MPLKILEQKYNEHEITYIGEHYWLSSLLPRHTEKHRKPHTVPHGGEFPLC